MKRKKYEDKVNISNEARLMYLRGQKDVDYEVVSVREVQPTPIVPIGLYFVVFSCVFTTLSLAYILCSRFILPFFDSLIGALS